MLNTSSSPLPVHNGRLSVSCSTRMYSHSPTCSSSSSLQPINLFDTSFLVDLGLQPSDVPYQRPASANPKRQVPVLIQERLQALLGEPLTSVDLASVQLMPSRLCLPRELVAVEDSNGILRYGKVKDEEDLRSSGEIKVQVSKTCIRWYAASQVYFFQSVVERRKNSSEDKVWNSDEENETETTTIGVIAEVNALLARLNVSLSASYEELLAKVWRLQHQAMLVEADRRVALQHMEQALRAQRDAEKALVCVVCLVNAVNRVLIPCGHSYCTSCVKRLLGSSCPVCRHQVSDSAAFRIS